MHDMWIDDYLENQEERDNHIIERRLWILLSLVFSLLSVFLYIKQANAEETNWLINPAIDIDTTVGTKTWTNRANAGDPDTNYAYVSLTQNQIAYYLRTTDYDYNLPTNATVESVCMRVKRRASNSSSIRDNSIGVYNQGTITNTYNITLDYWSTSNEYGSEYCEWGDPESPYVPTREDIMSGDFGVVFTAKNFNASTRTAYIDSIEVKITYTAPEIIWNWFLPMIAYASTTCEISETNATCTDPVITNPSLDVSLGLFLFLSTFFGLLFYFKTGRG